MNNNRELLLKKLIYQSVHRGCKETDILIGEFAKENIASYSEEQLLLYQQFISEDDMLIYDWILGHQTQPEIYTNLVMTIRSFHKLVNF